MNIASKALKGEIAKLLEQAAGRLSGRSPHDDELSKKLRAMTERLLRFDDSPGRNAGRSAGGRTNATKARRDASGAFLKDGAERHLTEAELFERRSKAGKAGVAAKRARGEPIFSRGAEHEPVRPHGEGLVKKEP